MSKKNMNEDDFVFPDGNFNEYPVNVSGLGFIVGDKDRDDFDLIHHYFLGHYMEMDENGLVFYCPEIPDGAKNRLRRCPIAKALWVQYGKGLKYQPAILDNVHDRCFKRITLKASIDDGKDEFLMNNLKTANLPYYFDTITWYILNSRYQEIGERL